VGATLANMFTAHSPPPLPNATYTYVIAEHASPMEATEKTRRTLDPNTFATRSYANDSDNRRILTVTIAGNSATLKQGAATTRLAAAPGAPFVVSDLFVGTMFQLPATLHAAKTTHLTLASLGFTGFKAEQLVASLSRASRPMNVPVRDSAVDVTSEGKTAATLWYDPQTFVLDECDMPAIRFTFLRTLPKR
jgi:hypothetical protein